ncbi:chondroitinase-B domain-containing protein [Parachryseolinea silvisoli]|uniref:chondroitinase-B domain-containing protein n=1 Tax=Parachryseolinea silvisoli TaxID=2873601 RepID=UPI002265B8B7|nr:chondroitinase-B domain-containing protein [Parachryseolinea silvisoli]MCD9019296.1 discoidin domain-containing protein [Parachryseolinea silvisoli]
MKNQDTREPSTNRTLSPKIVNVPLLFFLFIALPGKTHGQTVTSLSALQTAINNAAAGSTITLANGTYTASSDIVITKTGTASQPITIQAQSIGGVTIGGTAGFALNSPAAYIVIKGFRFTHSASQATMASGTNHCRWTRNVFDTPGAGDYLLLNGNDHEVDYNTFQNKEDPGKFIIVRGSGSQIAQRLWIHHNYFFNQPAQSGNGNETIQFGLSGYSLSNSNSIFEHNLFEQCAGENELLSVKASQLTIRYNTIRNCPAQFTLRHGNRSVIYGNYFVNTPGLRIFGDDHIIFSNHYRDCSVAIVIGNGDGEVADGAPLTSHDRPDRVLIVFNTLVNNTTNIQQPGRTSGLGSTYITVANNIIQGGGAAASIAGPYTNPTWSGNIIWNTDGAGAMPSGGYSNVNPLIAPNAAGTYHLQSGSPAIGTAVGSYPNVTADMDGQPRSSSLDKGADEVSSSPVTAQILSPSMVGQNGSVSTTLQNVALNKTVTASGSDTNLPTGAVDGDNTTRWSAQPMPQWLEVDLGGLYNISKTEVIAYQDRVYQFNIESKTTSAGSYTQIVNRSNNTTPATIAAPVTDTFSPVAARYVRITVASATDYTGTWASLLEFRIFGISASAGQNAEDLRITSKAPITDAENISIEESDSMLEAYPNPVSKEIKIKYVVKKDGHVKLFLSDTILSKSVSLVDEDKKAGIYYVVADLSSLPAGIHTLKLMRGRDTTVLKLLKK